ncbi:MAG: helix-hairpin-helix domain-containing protein [Patescibacteria group bacterium]|nr:helix-hairpin-helix domain-containing protein [Patescibacteria group bacterium]
MTNLEVAELLRDIAAAYQLKDETRNKFRIVAYQRAADSIEHLSSEIKDIWDEGKLVEIAGVGPSLAKHLDEIFSVGSSSHFADIFQGLPMSIFELMKIPGVGVKTAYKLVKELPIGDKDPIGDLEKLAKKGEIAKLTGFGEDSQFAILRSINMVRKAVKRHLLPYAYLIAEKVSEWILQNKHVVRVEPLGSLRRRVSTIGDVDIAVATKNPGSVLDHFVSYPKKVRIIEKGVHKASILLPGGMQVDCMVQDPESFGSLLQHFTGSKHHNIALREYALKLGFSLSEYGIRAKTNDSDKGMETLKKFKTEEEFYNFLGLDWIPPELRENTGEIEAAKNHQLPDLILLSDVKSDLQLHSDFDVETSHDLGASSMEELVDMANRLGYEYIAMTEHNPSKKGHSNDEIVKILRRKQKKVKELNEMVNKEKVSVKRVFNSLEIDILQDGSLPVPESAFETLDFALVSIHSSFEMTKEAMTGRVLSALSHPKVKIFAHPTARKLNSREGVEIDWDKVFSFCVENNKWIEINGDPMRLDLPDFLVREGVKKGVKFTFGTDAHHKQGMENMQWAVSVARRGWLTKNDVVNTKSLKDFEEML